MQQPIPENAINIVGSCRFGKMIFNKNDIFIGRSLQLYGEYSFFETELFAQLIKSGNTVVDIGANIGTHTLFFAKHVGPAGTVCAFEPQRCVFQTLCGNMAINDVFNVFCYPTAISRETTTLFVPSVDYSKPGNFGGVFLNTNNEHKEGFKNSERVLAVPLDSLGLTQCHFIKIDVEGMEKEVLLGSKNTIKKHRPIIYLENDRMEHSEELINLLVSLEYKLWWHLSALYNPNNYFNNSNNVFEDLVSKNMLCLPNENKTVVKGLPPVTDPYQFPPTGHTNYEQFLKK